MAQRLEKTRFDWIDQARGLSIFLVVYGHNFPVTEPYIYSFHVPLFFFISGMFHPKIVSAAVIGRRAKMILIPYFIWALALYLFWLFLGRNYGQSVISNSSPLDNLIGVFYAQGGQDFMDWGIPMWFLPCIFMVFVFFSAIQKLGERWAMILAVFIAVAVGFCWAEFAGIHLPWSVDVALVSCGFYALGLYLKPTLIAIDRMKGLALFFILLVVNFAAFQYNTEKVDMYRSIYGNPLLFFVSGIAGSLACVLLFKTVPVFKFLSYIGRHTIVLLATHIRMLTLIKLFAVLIFGITVFDFSELEKFLLAVAQIVLAIPIIWLVNKYAPVLDGKVKKA
jgi:fucose 4-O-acetylase-like acetyltransferase